MKANLFQAMKHQKTILGVGALAMALAGPVCASWLSDFTGINIDVPAGKVEVGRPDPVGAVQRLPGTIQRLPQDVANLANPAGAGLAFAIRQAKAQASYSARPIPAEVYRQLQPYFPAGLLQSVRYTTFDGNRITLDGLTMMLNGDVSAITLEDIVVFRNESEARNPVTWAHELTHVTQYRSRGVETFANMYTTNAWVLENEAKDVEARVAQALASNRMQPPNQGGGMASSQGAYFNVAGQLFFGDANWMLHPADPRTGQYSVAVVGRVFMQSGQFWAQDTNGRVYPAMRVG